MDILKKEIDLEKCFYCDNRSNGKDIASIERTTNDKWYALFYCDECKNDVEEAQKKSILKLIGKQQQNKK